MAKKRSDIYIESKKRYKNGEKLINIARALGIPEGTMRRWKFEDNWDGKKKTANNVSNERAETWASEKMSVRNEKIGRPQKEIDIKTFEKLCGLQCTITEMCSFFDCDDMTLSKWCKRTYNMRFSEIFAIKRGSGQISLRRTQFRLAEKNAAMAIFLGKQYLNQRDNNDQNMGMTSNINFIGFDKIEEE